MKPPTTGVETPMKEQNIHRFLVSNEYNGVLSVAGGNTHDYAIFQVFLQTGLRVSELWASRLSDLEMNARPYRLLHVRIGKGRWAPTLELEKKVAQALKNYLPLRPDSGSDAIFLNRYGEPISERGVRKLVEKYVRSSGITKKVSPHGFRHTFATQKAEKGVQPVSTPRVAGPVRLDTTQIYVHMFKRSGGA